MGLNKKNKSTVQDIDTSATETGVSSSDYLKQIQKEQARPSGQTNSPTSSTEDYYQLARDQEYGTLFDKEVALENAKANALKYTKNQINAQGFGGTGYGSTMQGGIYNTYMNKVGEANDEYNANIKEINQQEKEALETESALRAGNVTSMLQSSTSIEQMNNLLTEYGYGYVDKTTGEFKLNEDKPEGMSEDEWIQIKYYYNAQKSALDEGDGYTGSYATSEADFRNLTVPVENGRHTSVNDGWDKETSILFSHINVGDVNVGDVIKMTSGKGAVLYVEMTKNGLRVVNESAYNNATSQHEIVRNSKDNYSWR